MGGCRAGAVIRVRPPVLVVGGPHRHRGASGHGPLHAGARRHGCRHGVRRHRFLARNDDRVTGRARDAAHRVHGGAGGRHHPTLRGGDRLLDRISGPESIAGARAVRFPVRGGRGKRAHPDRQSGHPFGIDYGARGDGAGIFRPPPRNDRGRFRGQARALFLAHRLPVCAPWHCGPGRRGVRLCARDRRLPRQAHRARRAAPDRRDERRENARLPLSAVRRQRLCGGGACGLSTVRLERVLMSKLWFDIAHLLAGSMLVLSFALLYQDRITAVINVFALQAVALALSVAWQALVQGAPHLLVTAAIALVVKGFVIPTALHHIIRRLEIHREVEQVIGAGPTMLTGLTLVALSILLVQPVGEVSIYTREDLAFALAVILLGLLMMITRRNAVTQVVGFMSLENGLVLAATGAKGMPLVVEVSVAFSVLIAFIVFGVFIFRMRERFDTVDVSALDRFRGERRDTL